MTKMTEFRLSGLDEEDMLLEGDRSDDPRILSGILEAKMKPGQFYPVRFVSVHGPEIMENYIRRLQENGLRIGRGDAEFGYKMPLPEKDSAYRQLVIFRRR